ncbi:MAG TPA: hypothetical protein VFM82_03910 [Flavobacteriaceae bacterium]|nr:hypothetical protein [Flavobacteriaceae bacterium]
MKNTLIIPRITGMFFVLLTFSCMQPYTEKTGEEPFDGSMRSIEKFIGSDISLSMQLMGFQIHSGSNPPIVEGTFVADPLEILSSTLMDEWPGTPIEAQVFTLHGQNQKKQKLNYVPESEAQTGKISTAVISGQDGSFTVCFKISDEKDGYSIESIHVISGFMASNGIQQFQKAVFIKIIEGEAPSEIWHLEGKGRVIHEIDNIAQRQL